MLRSLLILALIPLSFLISLSAQGQVPVAGTEDMLDKLRLNRANEKMTGSEYVDIKGEVFLFPNFERGTLKIIDEIPLDGYFRYDMYSEQLEFRMEDVDYTFSTPHLMEYVYIGELKMIYSSYMNALMDLESRKSTYFVELVDGECQLLERMNVLMQKAEPPKLYQDAKPAEFKRKSDAYYLRLDDGTAIRIKKKKDISEILNDPAVDIASYIKKEKISVNSVEDLIKVVEYYNTY